MRKTLSIALACMAASLAVTSCSPKWYCYVDSVGITPAEKTYFAIPYFPQDVNPLVADEFMKDLDIVMAKTGYIKADSVNAHLRVYFAYRLGEMHDKIRSSSRPVFESGLPTTSYGYVTTPVITDGGVYMATNVVETVTTDRRYAGQETTVTSETIQDFEMRIDAYENNRTWKPVFTVSIVDQPLVAVTHDLRRYMPLYLLNAMPYIGHKSEARTGIVMNEHDSRLKWFVQTAPLD